MTFHWCFCRGTEIPSGKSRVFHKPNVCLFYITFEFDCYLQRASHRVDNLSFPLGHETGAKSVCGVGTGPGEPGTGPGDPGTGPGVLRGELGQNPDLERSEDRVCSGFRGPRSVVFICPVPILRAASVLPFSAAPSNLQGPASSRRSCSGAVLQELAVKARQRFGPWRA